MKSFFHSSISFFMPLFLGMMGTFVLFSNANAQCYVSSSETINFSSFGGNLEQEYETLYFLTNGDDIVLSISNTNSFAPSPVGQYKVYAINYLVGSNENIPQVGESIFAMSGDCFDISNAFDFLICPESDDCDLCEGEDISVNVLSENDDPDYTNQYFLTNESGAILEIQNSPDFGNYPPGVYIVYGINYLTSEGINGLFVGGNVSNVFGVCFDISALPQVVCPLPEAQLTAAPNCQDNETDNDPNDDYIEFEIVANVSSATYQIEINGFNSPQIASGTQYFVRGDGANGNPLLAADGQTTYTVEIVDGQGCTSSLQVGPIASCSMVRDCPDPVPYCCGADVLLTRTLIGDTRADNYIWYKKEGQTRTPIPTTETLDGNGNTVYEATVNEPGTYVLEDPNGDCVGDGCCPEILEPEEESPTWALDPQDITYECSSAQDYDVLYQDWLNQVISNPELYIDDNCEGQGNDITIIYDETENSLCADNSIPFERIVIFTPIDACGNRGDSRLATFAVQDSRGPVFDNSLAYNLQLDCGDQDLDQQIESFIQSIESSVSDDCSSVVVSNNYDPDLSYPIVCSPSETSFVIDFTAKDLCGNVSVASAAVSVVDQSPPATFMPGMNASSDQCGVPAVFAFNNWLINNANALYTDNCSSRIHWSNDFNGVFPFDCGQSGSIDVTFTASDDCGNSTSFTRSFTITDNNGPQWVSNPQNLVLDCSDGTNNDLIIQNWLNNNGNGLAYDECSRFNVDYSFNIEDLNETDCEGGVNNTSVQFTATDECGNSTMTTASISYFDQTPPVINCPADLVLNCNDLSLSELNDQISAYVEQETSSFDACDADVSITAEPLTTLPEPCVGVERSAVVNITAVDNCGNIANCQFTVELTDDIGPEIVNCPTDLVLECEEIHSYNFDAWLNTLVATDNCTAPGDLKVESNFDKGLLDVPCSTRDWNEHMLEIDFQVTDACGNTSTCSAIITVQDETAPELNCPEDLTLSCGTAYEDLTIERWLNSATATDNCDNEVRITNDFRPELLSSSLTCDYNLTEPISLTSMGGNTSPDYTTEYALADNAGVILEISNTPDFTNPGSGVFTAYAYNYENGSNFNGLFVGNNVSQITGDCFDRSTYPFTVCDEGASICDADGNNIPVLVRFTATDDCGNSTVCSANIFLIDETAPEIYCPADLVLECGNASNVDQVINWLRTVRAEDGCDQSVDIAHSLMGQNIDDLLDANSPCIDGSDGVIQVEFEAEDDCSNTIRCIGYIRIEDTSSPEISSCPERLEIACDLSLDYDEFVRNYVAQNLSFSDECQELNFADHVDVDIQGDLSAVCPDDDTPAFVTVELRVSDDCGNFSTCDFEVIVVDRQAPEILNCPSDLVLECEEIHSYNFDSWMNTLVATDNCTAPGDLKVESNFDKGLLDVPCSTRDWNEHMLEIDFQVTDACGNTSTCSAIITVQDETAPELVCPEDLTLSCGTAFEDITISRWLNSATATDNCDNEVRITNDFRPELLSSSLTCDYNLTEPISLSSMGGNTSPDYTTEYALADNAGVILEISNTPDFTNPGSGVYTAYAYNYENGSNFSGLQVGLNIGQVTGDCFDRSSFTFTVCEPGTSICDEDGNNVPILVRFTATDDCGNSTVCTANIFLIDETAPDIYCPADLVLECGNSSNVDQVINWLRTVRAEDGCDQSVDITHSLMGQNIDDLLEANSPCIDGNDGVIQVEFVAEDDCSNTSSCSAYIRIEDTTPPEIATCPERLEIACDPSLDYDAFVSDYVEQNLIFNDQCQELTFTEHVSVDIQGDLNAVCPDDDTPAFATVEIRVEDDCGNFTTCDFEVVVVDRQAPDIVNCPVNLTLGCDEVHEYDFEAWLGTFEATDDCSTVGGGLTLTNNFDHGLLDEPCSTTDWDDHVLTVTFTATDACGNNATCKATITVVDETPPLVDCPDALTLDCGAENMDGIIATWLNSVTATDDCDREVALSNDYDANLLQKPCQVSDDPFALQVTFTASDNCGNTATCVSEIIIIDESDPIVLCPDGSLVLECGHPENVKNLRGWLESARAEDDCDSDVEILTSLDDEDLEELIALNSPCENGQAPGRFEVVFTAIDDCGNEANCISEVLIYDTDEPEIQCVESLFIDCAETDEQVIENWLNSVTAADYCDEDVLVTNDFDIRDLESPCRGIGQNFELEVTFTATDNCGNTAQCISRIVISDDTPPTIDCPDELDLSCELDLETRDMIVRRWIGTASAIDNCDEEVQIMTSYTLGMLDAPCLGNGEDGRYEVVFTAMDDCGNTSKCVAFINITDEVAPVIQCPGDIVLECGEQNIDIAIADWLLSATATDDCDTDVAITNGFEASELSAYCVEDEPLGLTVTFTATDNCGNSSSCESTLTLVDESAPEIVCPPSPLILDCGDEHNVEIISGFLNDVRAYDACDADVEITTNLDDTNLSELISENSPCIDDQNPGSFNIVFTAVDDCGNQSTCEATVKIRDNTAPVLTCPTTLVLECGRFSMREIEEWLESATADDACDSDVDVTYSWDELNLEPCQGDDLPAITEVTFSAIDNCGNSTTCVARIRVEDNFVPEILCPREELILDCAMNMEMMHLEVMDWIAEARAFDACDDEVDITTNYTFGVLDEPCSVGDEEFAFEVIFTATDDCGNAYQCSQVIRVIDNEAPDIVCPDDLTLDCSNVNAQVTIANWLNRVEATDDCDSDVSISNDFDAEALEAACENGQESFSLTVTFTATDNCANTSSCESTITIEDNEAPEISCPSGGDLILECGDDLNVDRLTGWLSSATATDVCDPNVEIVSSLDGQDLSAVLSSNSPCENGQTNGEILVVFTATDACGNTSTCEAWVIIRDTEAPELICPPTLVLECGQYNMLDIEVWLESATAEDACDDDVQLSYSMDQLNLVPCQGDDIPAVTEVTFTATDDCGNSVSCVAKIRVEDNEPPEISCPEEPLELSCFTIEADQDAAVRAWISTAYATDACDDEVEITTNYTLGVLDEPCAIGTEGFTFEVVFTATDDCGNSAQCTQLITVIDNEAPDIVCPSDLTIDCSGTNSQVTIADWLNGATATDDCDSDVSISNDFDASELEAACASGQDQFSLTITFTATDNCGNTSSCESTITIEDNEAPEISCPSGGDLILECGDDLNVDRLTGWLSSAAAKDVCDPNVEINTSLDGQDLSAVLSSNSPCENGQTNGEILVVFTATDACGNVNSCEARVIIRDTEAPELLCPKTLILECGAYDLSEINSWLASAQSTDNCTENILVTNNFDPSQLVDPCLGDDSPSELEVSFTATDDCGNTVSCNAIIRIEDNEAPEIACPVAPLELSCFASEADQDAAVRAWIAGVTATDLCDDDVEVTTNYTRGVLDEPCSTNEEDFTFEVVFTATDDCGNTAQCTQVIIVIDNEAPDIVCPDDLTIDCGISNEGLTIVDWLNSVIATDNCDNDVEVTNNFGPELLTGGSSCDFNLNEDIELTAMGGNDSPDYTTEFILTDSSGVIIQLSATPYFTNPGAGIYTAYAYNYLNGSNFSGLQLGSNVSEVNGDCFDKTEYAFTVCEPSGICNNDGNDVPIVVTFTAIDDCGNTSQCTANLYLIDETAPDISCPSGGDLILECGDELNVDRLAGWLNSATATDVCDPDVDIVSSLDGQDLSAVLSSNSPCINGQTNGEILVVFTATDACGNVSTCEARVIIRDTEAPELLCPKTLVLECGAYDLSEINSWLASAQSTDNCTENVVVTNNFDPSQLIDPCLGDDIPSELEVSFTATDDCGNTVSCNAIIRIEDNEPPEITCPKLELVIGCGLTDREIAIAVRDWTQQATATDNCDPDVEITTDYRNGGLGRPCQGLGPNGWYEVTFTATDNCGNTSSCSQYIRVEDDEAPEFTQVPANKTVDCGDEIIFGTPQYVDNCDNNLSLTFTDTESNSGCLGESYIRTWTVSDNCGNTATASQEIVVEDDESPVFTFVADDITIDCDEPLVFSTPVFTDNCPDYLVLDYVDAINNAACVGEEIARTWILTDGCGNETTATQKITREYEAPEFVDQAPSDVTVECDNVPVAATLRGTVFCNQEVEIQADEEIIPGTCDGEYMLTRTWTLSDNCGNEIVESQIITVIDTKGPVITGVPQNTTIDALPLPALPNVEGTDNCSDVELDFNEVMTSNDCGLIAIRTWVATDDCGNTSSAEQTIIVSPDAFDVTLDLINGNDCFGDLEGSVLATVFGGVAPYTYSWSNGETGATATNLPSGPVTLMVTDANGCMGTASMDVPGPETPLEAEISIDSDLDCTSSGEVSAEVNGGTGPYVIEWSNGATGSTTTVNGIFVSVTVTDANGCVATDEEEVEESCFDLALIKVSTEDAVSPGDFINYTITIFNQGTSPAYNIHVNDDLPDGVTLADNQWRSVGGNVITLNDPVAFIPAGGSLPVTLRVMVDADFSGMMLLNRAEIVDADDDTNPANGKPQDFDSDYDEDFDNDVVGGDNTINNENGDEDDHDFDKIFVSTDCIGDYREEELTINCGDDAFLCLDIDITDAEDYNIQIDGSDYDGIYYVCDDDRVVQYDYCVLSDHGENGPYELISWVIDGVEYSTSFNDIYELVDYMNSVDPTGNWVLRETEQLIEGGDDSKQYNLMILRQLRLLGQPIAEMGASISYHPVGTSINLGGEPGMYIVTVAEPGSDCPDTIKVTIDEILPQLEEVLVENTCVGESDGSIFIDIVGNESNYLWTWTPNVSNGPTANNLAAGTYTVVIAAKNDPSCQITEQIEVEEVDATPLSVKALADATCRGDDGQVFIVPANAGTYIWSDGQTTNLGERTDLSAGDYSVSLVNATGCESELSFTIELENTLELIVESIKPAECDEGGSIELVVEGGSGSYSYEWSDDSTEDSSVRTDLAPGLYEVTVTDNAEQGCVRTNMFEILDDCACEGERIDTLLEIGCNEQAAYCTDIDEFDVNSWTITIDGQEYNGPFELCGEERFLRYQYDKLLGDGYFGPFEVIDWTVNGVSYSGTFDNIDEIVEFMNVNDPQGDWTLNRNTKRILGGLQSSDYGSLIIRQTRFQVTNRVDTFAIAEGQEATKIAIPISEGTTTILLQGPDAECPDTVVTTVVRTGDLDAFVLYTLPASCYQANGVASLFPPDLDYQWSDGGTGNFRADLIHGVYNVTATDGNCSTELNVVITRNIGSGCDDCEEIILASYLEEEIEDCDEHAEICVEVNPNTFNGTQFRLDDQLIDLDDPCRTDTVQYAYNYTLIPDNGSVGPYSLDSWMINGQTYSGSFDDLTELVELMNALDADGNWSLTQTGEITGAMEGDMPGSMVVTQMMTGMQVHIHPEVLLGPVAYIVEVPVGQHELFAYNALTGCRDTAWIEVLCDEELIANDDQVTMRTEQRSLDIDVLANDEFRYYDFVRITEQPENGWARVGSAGQIVYHSDLDRCEQANKDELNYELISGERTDRATVTIDYGCSTLTIPQVISLDGNGLNNRFDIEGMTPDKKVEVTIFNTLGQVVYHEADYQSVPAWDGSIQNYRNGYSSATYFYMVRQGGEAPITGYIQVLR